MARRVLVGLDGSPASLRALDWAARYVQHFAGSLHLVSSYALPTFLAPALDGGFAAFDDAVLLESARGVLIQAREHLAEVGIRASAATAVGDPTGVLIALSRDYDLVVVGTRGRGGFKGRLLGTVSAALPAHAACPVVVVPHRKESAGVVPLASDQGAPRDIKRIVVGVDGSEIARAAIYVAIEQALGWDAELVAVSGVPVSTGGTLAWLPAQVDHEQVLTDVRHGLDAAMDRYEREFPGLAIRRVVLDGSGAELLTEFSAAADLLVVGSRGRGGFRGLLLGSTSQAVLHHAACPVMVVGVKPRPVP